MQVLKHLSLLVGFAVAISPTASSSITTFTSETAFLTAVGATSNVVETFEMETVGLIGTTATIGNLTFSCAPSLLSINNTTHPHGATNTTAGGTQYLFADSGVPAFHDDLVCGLVGGAPMTAWGATFTDLEVGPIVFFVDGVKRIDTPVTGINASVQFFGFVAVGETFQTVTLDIPDFTYGIDGVRTASCPPGNYGGGCVGTGGYVPKLAVTPCEVVAGGAVQLSVSKGLGGANAILVLGLLEAATPVGGGCFLNVTPLLPVQLVVPLHGAGAGAGSAVLPGVLPAGSAGVSLTLQMFVVDAGVPIGFSSTGGYRVDIQ